MTFDPFEEKHAKAILKKACKGKSLAPFQKNFEAVVTAKMGPPGYDTGGVSIRLGEECLALAEIVAVARGNGSRIELPVVAEDWLNTGLVFDDDLAAAAMSAVDKVRTRSASWSIVEDMGGWPAWTNYCRGLSTRLKKPAKKRKATAKAEGIGAVIKRLRGKQCRVEIEKGEVVELRCSDESQVTDGDMADVAQLRKLRVLILTKQSITDRSLGQLSSLKQLRDLAIDQCRIKGTGFKDLDLPKLRELSFGRSGANVAIANCRHLTGLRRISLRMSDVTDKGLEKLAFATSLTSLNIDQCKKLKGTGFNALTGLKKLTEIKAIQVQFSAAGFDAICGFTGLKKVNLMSAKLPVKKLGQLASLTRLEYLDLFRIPV